MFGFDLHWWEGAMLISLMIAALAAIAVGISTTAVVRLQRQEVKDTAEAFTKYRMDTSLEIERAKADAAEANARGEAAKADAAKANERIIELQRVRRLGKDKAALLVPLLRSELFQTEPKPALRIGAVADSEARMYAMDFQRLCESCGVNIYPTEGGLPNEVVQTEQNADGLIMTVKSIPNPNQAFSRFQHQMVALGLTLRVEENPTHRDNEAMLVVLRKPT